MAVHGVREVRDRLPEAALALLRGVRDRWTWLRRPGTWLAAGEGEGRSAAVAPFIARRRLFIALGILAAAWASVLLTEFDWRSTEAHATRRSTAPSAKPSSGPSPLHSPRHSHQGDATRENRTGSDTPVASSTGSAHVRHRHWDPTGASGPILETAVLRRRTRRQGSSRSDEYMRALTFLAGRR
jgi:hypothetical protein